MGREILCHHSNGRRAAQIGKLRHLQPCKAARIDAREGRKIHVNVESQAVIARTAADSNAEARKFALPDVHPRSIAARLRLDAQFRHVVDDARLERTYEIAHAQSRTLEINKRIHDELPGPMIGNLATAIDL